MVKKAEALQIVHDKFKRKKTETVYNICKINEKTVTSFDKEQAKESYSV